MSKEIDELREKIRRRIEENKTNPNRTGYRVLPPHQPRYDEVFYEGQAWLEELARMAEEYDEEV